MGKYKTIQELKENNGWAKLKVNNLWDESGKYIFEGEEDIIRNYNDKFLLSLSGAILSRQI